MAREANGQDNETGLFYQVSMWYLICSVHSFSVIRPALPCGLQGKSRFDTLRLSHYGKQQFGKGGESDA